MAEWTRGQLMDKIAEQAHKSPKYFDQLMKDPRALMAKQLGTNIPASINVKVLQETETPTTSFCRTRRRKGPS